jgi:quercetin dioxygenase-like cupin family protein/DNA-binding Xre family transcriptional regulator
MEGERLQEVGWRIRDLRRKRGLGLRGLSEQCGLSVGFLSQIERGLSSFSIPSLRAICGALDVSLAEMLVMSNGPGKAFLADPRPAAITRGDNRSFVSLSDVSTKYRFLSAPFPGRRFEVFIGEMAAGSEHDLHQHEGEEFGYVLGGELDLTIGEEHHHLGSGDSYHLLATTPHACAACEKEGATVLWVQTARYARAIALLGSEPAGQDSGDGLHGFSIGSGVSSHVQRSDTAVTYRFLSGSLARGRLQILVAEMPTGYEDRPRVYEGEEFGYVLEGRVRLSIGEESYLLGNGDCYHLPASNPHGHATGEDDGAKLLLVRMAVSGEEAEKVWRAATEEPGTSGAGTTIRVRSQQSGGTDA